MKFKTIKAFEEFFHFDREDEFAPERQDNDPATQEDEIINYGDVEEEDEIYGSEYNDPTEQELLPGDLPSDSDCDTCEHEEEDNSDKRINNFDNFFMSSNHEKDDEVVEEEEEERENNWGDEGIRLERFSTFNEKKKATPAQKKQDLEEEEEKDDKKTTKKGEKPDFLDSKKEDKDSKKFVKPKKGEIPAALAAYQKNKKK